MKVRFFGFTLDSISKTLTLDQWGAYLHQSRPDIRTVDQGGRLLLLDNTTNPNYRLGLVVTVKDQRRLCQLVNDAGELRVRVSQVEEGSSILDFNFFVVNKKTGSGMYQHYHQSCSVANFGILSARSFNDFKKSKGNAEYNALTAQLKTDKSRKKIEKNNVGRLKWTQLVRQEELTELLRELERIKSFEYILSTPTVEENEFLPLEPYLKAKSTRISFGVGTPGQLVIDGIASYVSSGAAKSGRVEGEDENGNPQYISILNNPDNFGEYEYDTVADKLNELDLTAFQDSWVISELLAACASHSHIIEVPRQP